MSSWAVSRVSGSVQDLEQLFREHYAMLYRTAYGLLKNAADAEDVPQTIFLRLLRSGMTPDARSNPRGYLFRATVNLSLDKIRSRKREVFIGAAQQIEIAEPDSDANDLEALNLRLSEAIAQLEPEAAQIVLLRYLHDQSDADIAKLLGTSRGAIAMRLFRARARLKKLMRISGEGK